MGLTQDVTTPSTAPTHRARPAATVAAGAFFACMAGVHLGIVKADPTNYAGMADASPWGFVRSGWDDVFMAHPAGWGLAVAAGELVLAVLLLRGGPLARVGWVGVVAFQVLLVLFGWGFLLWSVPATAVLVWGARHDWYRLEAPGYARR